MIPVSYSRASSIDQALQVASGDGVRLLGGGTNLVDLMRKGVERPSSLVDVTALSDAVEETNDGGLLIGAAARNSVVAAHRLIRTRHPMLARAILAGASAQIRNMATVGGNLMQRTRCLYFQDVGGSRCNKRVPGSGCDAAGGFNRYHAIIGASPACSATHPSDMCVALAALEAKIETRNERGARAIPIADFHRLPGDQPQVETSLMPGELVTSVLLPPTVQSRRSAYVKARDRAAFAFALASAAVVLDVESGTIRRARVALGGVATKPWRCPETEHALVGQPAAPSTFAAAAALAATGAVATADNRFKIQLAERVVRRALAIAAGQA